MKSERITKELSGVNDLKTAGKDYIYALLNDKIYRFFKLDKPMDRLKLVVISNKDIKINEIEKSFEVDLVPKADLIKLMGKKQIIFNEHEGLKYIYNDNIIGNNIIKSIESLINYEDYVSENKLEMDDYEKWIATSEEEYQDRNNSPYNENSVCSKATFLYFKSLTDSRNSIKCKSCGSNFPLHIDYRDGNILIPADKSIKIKKSCYRESENDFVTVKMTGPSGKFIVMNDLRGAIIEKYDYDEMFGEMNCKKSMDEAICNFAEKDIIVSYVGNNGLVVIPEYDHLLLSNETGLIENNEKDRVGDSIGHISCALWWIMATAIENVDMDAIEKSGENYVIVDTGFEDMYAKFYFNAKHRSINYIKIDYDV